MNTKRMQNPQKRKKLLKKKDTYSTIDSLVKTNILGIDITNASQENILEYIIKNIQKTKENIFIVTPNPEMIVFSRYHPDFKDILNNADLALCDGMQLYRAARFLGHPLKTRILGTDFMEMVCERVQDWPITVGFLGAGSGVAEKVAECLLAKYPRLKIVFVGEEWEEKIITQEISNHESRITNHGKKNIVIRNSKFVIPKIDILFIAFGFPKQEEWMAEHIDKIPVRVMIGVGGAFDQIANPSLRPPKFLHTYGLGWLYRLMREPWRIKRQIKLVEFVWAVLQEKMKLMP